MATGVHVMSFTAPALAEQEHQADARDERNVVTHPPTAASDGMPVPALAGAVVLAFAVGIAGGQVHRRRRIAHRRAVAIERPAPVPTPPARPAPPPPETATPEPKAVEVAAPVAPVPPPPKPRPAPPRAVAPPAAPAQPAPEPPRERQPARTDEPLRFVPLLKKKTPRPDTPVARTPRGDAPRTEAPRADAPRTEAPRADAPLADSPEVPRAQQPSRSADLRAPLETAPEAFQAPAETPPAAPASHETAPGAPAPRETGPAEPVSAPARRFARPVPWPKEAEQLWTCEIAWKAGYRKSTFRAMAGPPGPGKRRPLAESPAVRWALMGEPEPPTPDLAIRVRALVDALEAAGWEHIGRGKVWYAQRFVWRGPGEPQPVAVPELAEPAEG